MSRNEKQLSIIPLEAEPEVIAGKTRFLAPVKIWRQVSEGAKIKAEMDDLKRRLDAIHLEIADYAKSVSDIYQTGTVRIRTDETECKVAFRDTWKVADPDALMGVLKERFHDLVDIRQSYSPTGKLKEMLCDADNPDVAALRQCVSVEAAKPAVSYAKK